MTDFDVFGFIMDWYSQQCDGDWEHQFGLEIGTLDNPGWSFKVDLVGTDFEGRTQGSHRALRTRNDWIFTSADGDAYTAYCGPKGLPECIAAFKAFLDGDILPGLSEVPGLGGIDTAD